MTKWRPLLFKSVEELQEKINQYFQRCDNWIEKSVVIKWQIHNYKEPIPYTITWLASYLWTNRQTLINYEDRDLSFFDTIKKAKEKIEANMEERWMMWLNNPAVTIFSLKNNYNWIDKQEVNQNNLNLNRDITTMSDEDLEKLINSTWNN